MNANTENMNVCLVQTDIHATDKFANMENCNSLLQHITVQPHLIVLPELFSCGFSVQVAAMGETMNGESIQYMRQISLQYDCAVVGSVPVITPQGMVNRLYWAEQGTIAGYYDKKHLFFGCEKQNFIPGNAVYTANMQGWRCRVLTCYDIRFPLWCRNSYTPANNSYAYDVLVAIANFPASRAEVFDTLLRARAMENQCYVLAVNRVGEDGYGVVHHGGTQVISPLGRTLARMPDSTQGVLQYTINKSDLLQERTSFPVGNDWD